MTWTINQLSAIFPVISRGKVCSSFSHSVSLACTFLREYRGAFSPGVRAVPVNSVAVGHHLGARLLAQHTHPQQHTHQQRHFYLQHLTLTVQICGFIPFLSRKAKSWRAAVLSALFSFSLTFQVLFIYIGVLSTQSDSYKQSRKA